MGLPNFVAVATRRLFHLPGPQDPKRGAAGAKRAKMPSTSRLRKGRGRS